ncbi:MAG TPA: DUF1840 domain-containing protein [Rhodocyclaceae bacterium]|nr:DUF1840 domain-containing protein [Rhodocyclaceae bacterium]
MIIFRSDAAADIMMFDDVAKRMMAIMGKEYAPRGIITVEQLPEAIARLKAAIAEDRARHAGEYDTPETEETPGGGQRAYVGLAQRAVPLMELLEYSLKDEKPVLWGV